MDPIPSSLLLSLSPPVLHFVEDQLSNNEVDSDEELFALLTENGLTEEQARQALTYRDLYLQHIYIRGFTPIRMGAQALRYNPHRCRFESA